MWILLIASAWCYLPCFSVLCISCKFIAGFRGLIRIQVQFVWTRLLRGGVCLSEASLWLSVSVVFQATDTPRLEPFIPWGLNGDLLISSPLLVSWNASIKRNIPSSSVGSPEVRFI